MSAKPFHLAWFLQGSSVQAWGEPWTGKIGTTWMQPTFFLDMARALERCGFDYILIEDSSYVGESYGGNTDIYLKNGIAVPRQDPSVVASLMLAQTSRIGIVPTFGTFAYHPYLLARLVATLDQVSGGRGGWNAVTGSSDFAAMNFGLDGMPEHDMRYEMADEYMACVKGLWDTWEPGAIIADEESGVLIDPTKVHPLNYEGKYFKTRGPLNSGPAPQGRPVIAQAGGSSRGRQFASEHADTIVVHTRGPEAMKKYRDDIRARMAAAGRDPDSCKLLYLVNPIIGQTSEEARERKAELLARAHAHIDIKLAHFSKITNIDFSEFDLDEPLRPGLKTNGHQQSLDEFIAKAKGKTLRQAMQDPNAVDGSVELVGSLDEVASKMEEVMSEVGGDGFLFSMPNVTRRTLAEIEDGLIPVLQKRGLTRSTYTHETFRDNLLEY
ncbi:NtaA/DmoA family FMN-dependent monooxygenase [Acuticoccus mangrovi]|uniref:NtaA/DmoA family FMN-dependent monooxygenase n=1 Tax=Acuticoccus mangrovi TaxID=2796142 RepID=A0A934IHH1_9HYPH|nr:NtaA/DmoA family FMN-dependent monooxygenase [Acuticoccus mangrovi]MBJ3775081.1 NtaA/DmoA family FMN-dependent monooxygenase [Acuticoccus mangrovi]